MVRVKVTQGWLEGEELDTVTGDTKYYSFKGIPYAEPPIGKLRFKAPRPPIPWEEVRIAIEHGPVCPQVDIFTKKYLPGDEDCLYLNVYSPELNPKNLLPVMFFIHGGAFKSGSGNVENYGPDFLVQHKVVLVTINYRLEALGFLCLDTAEVPGNAGLKDQVAALKWVKENIANFGGDSNNVTIFGESAGGASVSLHIYSPMSKGLFKRAISMSSVAICDWAVGFEPRRRAFKLGKKLGCDTDDVDKLLEYLQSVPVEQLVDTKPYLLATEEKSDNLLKIYLFVPVAEKNFGGQHFLTEEISVANRRGHLNEVDILIGHTNEELVIGIPAYESHILQDYNTYPELLLPREIILNIQQNAIMNLVDKIQKYYFGNEPINTNIMREFINYANDIGITYYINKFIRQLPNIGKTKRYFYKFSCVSDRNVYGKLGEKYGINGASHLDDLMYIFDAKVYNLKVDKNSKEYQLIRNFCTIFTNFAKHGTPTPDTSFGLIWPEYNNETKSYVEIGDTLTIKHGAGDDVNDFWDGIYRSAGME